MAREPPDSRDEFRMVAVPVLPLLCWKDVPPRLSD
jgi:hypothetical protein